MPRYFLHLRFRDGTDGLAVDEVRNWLACTFEVTDEAGQVVLTLPFSAVPAEQ